ncbi:annexin A7-like [Patiria miniata]|uniref:Membrane protein BRI3 n=1 Tax=Patiria miniata TaxID=46514 RepID=A0A914ALM0_PATMI|nr:annexin A7-like [Patiria miniata]
MEGGDSGGDAVKPPMDSQQAPPYSTEVGPPAPAPAGYPQAGAGGYPPQQGGYPQQGYPPPQQGYPPPSGQPGYPPQQQQGYPPQQQGYPPQQQQPPTVVAIQQPAPATQVVVTGGCPTCHVGMMTDSYTACGIILAICFFPLGVICCLMMKERKCTNCGATFG